MNDLLQKYVHSIFEQQSLIAQLLLLGEHMKSTGMDFYVMIYKQRSFKQMDPHTVNIIVLTKYQHKELSV